MGRMMLGVETEFAFTALDESGASLDRDRYVPALLDRVKARRPYLYGPTRDDVYLDTGARLYIDCGRHPEWSTPECTSPEEVVRYVRAGEGTLARAAHELESSDPRVAKALLFKSNVDYVNFGATWGSHESYLYERPGQQELARELIPHFASRLIYTGAGGLNPHAPGIEFTLSPRVAHLQLEVSAASTERRGIYHTRNEPLARRGYNRLHVLCGESLCSQRADYLRLGATALIVRLHDAGLKPAEGARTLDSLGAMRTFAADPSCTARVEVEGGRSLSALEIQRHYLEQVESRVDASFMPSWAADVCRHWRQVLDGLESGPESLVGTLDWTTKLAIFRNYARQRGIDWESLFPLKRDPTADTAPPECMADESLAFRAELCEIDMRFGQLGDDGVFTALDRAGSLDHRIVDDAEIAEAETTPPANGRARVRGELIAKLAERRDYVRCDWHSIHSGGDRKLRLSDPFGEELPDWEWLLTDPGSPKRRPGRLRPSFLLDFLDELG